MPEPDVALSKEVIDAYVAYLVSSGKFISKGKALEYLNGLPYPEYVATLKRFYSEREQGILGKRQEIAKTAKIDAAGAAPVETPTKLPSGAAVPGPLTPQQQSQLSQGFSVGGMQNYIPPTRSITPEGTKPATVAATEKVASPVASTASASALKDITSKLADVTSPEYWFSKFQQEMIKTDPCANLSTAKERYACYVRQIGKLEQSSFAFDEGSGVYAYYSKRAEAAKVEADEDLAQQQQDLQLETERANIQNQIRSRQVEAAQLLQGAEESILGAKMKALNEGIVMAPGQEYLYGQGPGEWLESAMRTPWVGLPDYKAEKFPHMPVDVGAPLRTAKESLAKTDIPGFGGEQAPPSFTGGPSFDSLYKSLEGGAGGATFDSMYEQLASSGLPVNTGDADRDRKNAYYNKWLPYAKAIEAKYGLPAEYSIAISANETGWGANNDVAPFGIKGKGQSGKSFMSPTQEYDPATGKYYSITDEFASYDDPMQGFEHLVQVLNQSNFNGSWDKIGSPYEWAKFLNDNVYATSPTWWKQIGSIIEYLQGQKGG